MNKRKPVPTTDAPAAWANSFTVLLKVDPPVDTPPVTPQPAPKPRRGRVDIIRQTAHRGGKTVTVIAGFTGASPAEIKALAKEMQATCGAGGTVKEGRIEIQGDHRDVVARILTTAGFRPVFAGG